MGEDHPFSPPSDTAAGHGLLMYKRRLIKRYKTDPLFRQCVLMLVRDRRAGHRLNVSGPFTDEMEWFIEYAQGLLEAQAAKDAE
jgi:hypothetical protein